MKKLIEYKGETKSHSNLKEALELVTSLNNALACGKVEFSLSYEKDEGSSTLIIQTIAKPTDDKPEQTA
ncbi:hypothetical protein SH501x_000903 [Pirellulaceae bacterium SH501]